MTCHDALSLLSPLLDGELSTAETTDVRAHLATCAECRLEWEELQELETQLQDRLTVRHETALLARVDRLIDQSLARPVSAQPVVVRPPAPRPKSWGVVVLAAALLVAVLTLLRLPGPPAPAAPVQVASVAYAVGDVEIQRPGAAGWSPLRKGVRAELEEGCRLRTPRDGMCEVQTSCEGTLRLNRETEVVVHVQERVELVRGELWAQAARQCELDIQLPVAAKTKTPPISVFTCPSSSELQWRIEDSKTTCMATSSPVSVKHQDTPAPVSIGRGQAMAMVEGRPDEITYRGDALAATSWQMPLLAQKPPEDSELQARLDAMLATIGETKVSYLFEEQIEQLGPAGTIPLLAYVRSSGSQAHPARRHRAMNLVLKMASRDQIEAVRELLSDPDPIVRDRAAATIRRLQPQAGTL